MNSETRSHNSLFSAQGLTNTRCWLNKEDTHMYSRGLQATVYAVGASSPSQGEEEEEEEEEHKEMENPFR